MRSLPKFGDLASLVADFTQGETGPHGGVYYEAGFAHGLNIPMVFTCRKDTLKNIHFDTRQYPHIVWETLEELRDGLHETNLCGSWGWSAQKLGDGHCDLTGSN